MSTPLSELPLGFRPVRHPTLVRWVMLCAAAEGIGMTAAAASARLTTAIAPPLPIALLLVVIGGLVEGIAIGCAQALGLRELIPALRRRRWALITTVVAGLGWAAASAPATLSPSGDDSTPPLLLIAVLALGLGGLLGAALGAAQATALRGIVRRPRRWIGVSAVAWAPTMAVIFVGATTPDARWPDAAVVALGTLTGVVAGSILALVSWLLLPLLDGSTATNEVVKSILRSPVHPLLDGSVIILRVRGTVSGRLLDIPVQFAGTGADLVVVASRPDSKRWWRNLVPNAPVRVLLRGRWRAAVASVPHQGDDEFERAAGLYRALWPRVRIAPDTVIVTLRLD